MRKFYLTIIKPLSDFVIAFFALLVLLPLILIVAFAVKISSPGPVFFIQERLGLNGRVFSIYKFRSMRLAERQDFVFGQVLTENHPRITKVGKFLRKTSFDEIPQLINILKGEMSFIGPRPPVTFFPKKYEDYTEFEKQRFKVKPGISGLAAVKQREVNDWSKNIPMDVVYVNKVTLWIDIQLFLASLLMFFRTDNIYTKIEE